MLDSEEPITRSDYTSVTTGNSCHVTWHCAAWADSGESGTHPVNSLFCFCRHHSPGLLNHVDSRKGMQKQSVPWMVVASQRPPQLWCACPQTPTVLLHTTGGAWQQVWHLEVLVCMAPWVWYIRSVYVRWKDHLELLNGINLSSALNQIHLLPFTLDHHSLFINVKKWNCDLIIICFLCPTLFSTLFLSVSLV